MHVRVHQNKRTGLLNYLASYNWRLFEEQLYMQAGKTAFAMLSFFYLEWDYNNYVIIISMEVNGLFELERMRTLCLLFNYA